MADTVEVPIHVITRWRTTLMEANGDLFDAKSVAAHERIENVLDDMEEFDEVMEALTDP